MSKQKIKTTVDMIKCPRSSGEYFLRPCEPGEPCEGRIYGVPAGTVFNYRCYINGEVCIEDDDKVQYYSFVPNAFVKID